MLDFAVKTNIILWEGPHTESHKRLIEKFGWQTAKAKTLAVVFQGVKLSFEMLDREAEKELLSEA